MMTSESKRRIFVGLILGTIVVPLVLVLPAFAALLFIVSMAILYETADKLSKRFDNHLLGIFVFVPISFYVLAAASAAFALRSYSLKIFFLLGLGTIICDSFAYFGGRAFGRTPFFPSISPKKTLEGVACGFAATTVFVWLFSTFISWYQEPGDAILIAPVLISSSAVIGDLVESKFKRWMDVKDAGSSLGPHGGFSDRVDSHLMVYLIMFCFFYLSHYFTL